VVRNTYPELRTTTIKTWQEWVGEEHCPLGSSHPLSGRVRKHLHDGTRMDMEVLFLALDRPRDVRKVLSLELTGAWINEAREVPREILDALCGRVGRFPPRKDFAAGAPRGFSGILMDTNPPDDDHWWYALAEEERPRGWDFFRQPPALLRQGEGYAPNPAAENAANQPLGHDYWLRQVAGKSAEWVNVYLLGRYGTVVEGRPVYPEYDDALHASPLPLEPVAGEPLLLGWDFGLTPACVLAQVAPTGALHVLDEAAVEPGGAMGIRGFARDVVLPMLRGRYQGLRVVGVGDPAGRARAQTDGRTCMEELDAAGLPARPARSNAFLARREAVAGFLSARPDNGPGLLLSPRCRLLRKGFLGRYRLERLAVAGEARYRDRPVKDRHSHVHDALQYAALAAQEGRRGMAAPRRLPGRPADAAAGY
jgi:hypothetical protein